MCTPNISIYVGMMSGTSMDGVDAVACVFNEKGCQFIARSFEPYSDMLRESLAHEEKALNAYYALLDLVEGKSVLLEEYARQMIEGEELHADEVNKMLRRPGEIAAFSE